MKDFTSTLILLLIILLKSGLSHVTMHEYHEQTGYPVSYTRLIGPTSTSSMTMNHGRMTLHPVPTHTTTTTLWPAQSSYKNSQHPSPSTWTRHQDVITTPSPWKIIIPSNPSYEHNHTPNQQKITVIHHHVIHRIQHKTQKSIISQPVVTSTVRPRSTTTLRVVSTTTTTEAPVTRTSTTTTTGRAEVTERSASSRDANNCSGEKQKQEFWESEESLERNFPLYSDY